MAEAVAEVDTVEVVEAEVEVVVDEEVRTKICPFRAIP